MKCPTCPDSTLLMSDRSGIEIDYCPSCRGVWLDRGELDKIIERASPAEPALSAQPKTIPDDRGYSTEPARGGYDHKYGSDGKQKKRKSSLLGDLFEF